MKTTLKIFRVTSAIDPSGWLVKAPTKAAAIKHIIAKHEFSCQLPTQDELIEAGQNGETASEEEAR